MNTIFKTVEWFIAHGFQYYVFISKLLLCSLFTSTQRTKRRWKRGRVFTSWKLVAICLLWHWWRDEGHHSLQTPLYTLGQLQQAPRPWAVRKLQWIIWKNSEVLPSPWGESEFCTLHWICSWEWGHPFGCQKRQPLLSDPVSIVGVRESWSPKMCISF